MHQPLELVRDMGFMAFDFIVKDWVVGRDKSQAVKHLRQRPSVVLVRDNIYR